MTPWQWEEQRSDKFKWKEEPFMTDLRGVRLTLEDWNDQPREYQECMISEYRYYLKAVKANPGLVYEGLLTKYE